MNVLILVVGFVLLVCGADKFVEGASGLARKLGVPSLIVGLTVVAFGTSAPELAVSVTAGLQGANEIALGNVLGSNIFNLLVVIGCSAMMKPLVVDKELLHRDWIYSIVSVVLLALLLVVDMEIRRLDGMVLLIGFGIVIGTQIYSARKTKKDTDEIKQMSNKLDDQIGAAKTLLYIVMGLLAIVVGGQLAVTGATGIARNFQVSETIIGLTIVAIGTSLPELVTSVVATKRGENNIAIGNVIGSNIFNVLFILGVSVICNPIPVQMTGIYDIIVLLVVSIALYFVAKKGQFERCVGIGMVIAYIGYTVWIIYR